MAAVMGHLSTARRTGHRDIGRCFSDAIDIVIKRPILAELDGDAVGPRQRMTTRARPGALLVRMPAVEGQSHHEPLDYEHQFPYQVRTPALGAGEELAARLLLPTLG